MRTILSLMFCLSIAGCAANTQDPPEAPCQELSGIYDFTFEETSGTCMPIAPSVVNVDYVGDGDCEIVKVWQSESQCHYQLSYNCPHPSDAHSDLTGTMDISVDGNTGSGTLHFTMVDDVAKEDICSADYKVVIKRAASPLQMVKPTFSTTVLSRLNVK